MVATDSILLGVRGLSSFPPGGDVQTFLPKVEQSPQNPSVELLGAGQMLILFTLHGNILKSFKSVKRDLEFEDVYVGVLKSAAPHYRSLGHT